MITRFVSLIAVASVSAAVLSAQPQNTISSADLAVNQAAFPQYLLPHEEDGAVSLEQPHATTIRLGPNGADTARWTVTVTDQEGQPVPNALVTFSVEPVYPLGWWRNMSQVRKLYQGSTGWQDKRLVGSVSPARAWTDAHGKVATEYTASHIGGDDPKRSGEERLIAKLSNGASVEATVHLGYTHLRKILEIAGGLESTEVAVGRYAHRDIAAFLEQLGKQVNADGWPQPVRFTGASYPWGGMIPPHAGHLHGLTIDLRPMSTDGKPTTAGNPTCPKSSNHASNYDRPRTILLAGVLKRTNAPVRLFNDAEISAFTCASGHHSHLHVSWLDQSRFYQEISDSRTTSDRASSGVLRIIESRDQAEQEVRRLDYQRILRPGMQPLAEAADLPWDLRSTSPGSLGLGVTVYFSDGSSTVVDFDELLLAAESLVRPESADRPQIDLQDVLPLDGEVVFVGEVSVPDFGEDPFAMLNEEAADTHQVREMADRYGLTGQGVAAAVWDEAAVRTTHVELAPRAKQADDVTALSNHATHVAGTIGARGQPNTQARGMGPSVALHCYDWQNDTSEMLAASDAVVCSNHSYGKLRGWAFLPDNGWVWWGTPEVDEDEDYYFGKYSGDSYLFDRVVEQKPQLTVLVAAGNDRNDAPPSQPVLHWVRQGDAWIQSERVRLADNWDRGGFDTIAGAALAKNVITIGAIHDMLTDPPTPESIRLTEFSCWGPTDDGRVKPDLVANGWQLRSTSAADDDAYMQMSGTSMATPAATGICALLAELFAERRSRTPYADELKAALVHTAMSPNEGPSYQIGWGSIRADEAADLVAGATGCLLRRNVAEGELILNARSAGGMPIRVTAVWIDPAGEPNGGGLDEPRRCLVNDLNLELVDPRGQVHRPWVLDPLRPMAIATRDVNLVDNVERVDVPAGEAHLGQWTIRVTGPTTAVALAISGLECEE